MSVLEIWKFSLDVLYSALRTITPDVSQISINAGLEMISQLKAVESIGAHTQPFFGQTKYAIHHTLIIPPSYPQCIHIKQVHFLCLNLPIVYMQPEALY